MSAEPRKFNFDFSYWSHDGFKEEGNGYMVPDKSHANGNKYADQVGMTYRCLFELKCFASKKLSTGRDQHNWTGQDFRIEWWPLLQQWYGESRLIESLEEYQLIIPINLFHNTFSFIFRWYSHSRQVFCHFDFYSHLVHLTKYCNLKDTGQSVHFS